MILGLDASTRCVGWCLLSDDGSLVDVGYIWLDKIKNEYAKLDAVEFTLQTLQKLSQDFHIYIEAPVSFVV